MTPNEIRKGDRVTLRDGTTATVLDNKRGAIRMIEVPALFGPAGMTDMGSSYVSDWARGPDGERVTFPPALQQKLDRIRAAGF